MTIPNFTTTTQTVNTEWLRIARPIIQAMFAVEDAILPVTRARLDDPKGYRRYSEMSPAAHVWEEAQSITGKAVDALRDILQGIRDNALCDAYMHVDYGGADDAITEAEEFNEALARDVMSVDAAIKMIGDEQ